MITIFLGEDDKEDTHFFEEVVSSTHPDYRVKCFENGAELILDLYRTVREIPAIVFLDVTMPVLDGINALTQIRQTPSLAQIPVFILSGSDAEHHIQDAYGAGVDGYLVKPVTSLALSRLVEPAITYGTSLLTRL